MKTLYECEALFLRALCNTERNTDKYARLEAGAQYCRKLIDLQPWPEEYCGEGIKLVYRREA